MAAPERLVRMRDEGLLGRKSGRGFFTYEKD
jgi:3-hydroxyacyl-CoA dehydrogenase